MLVKFFQVSDLLALFALTVDDGSFGKEGEEPAVVGVHWHVCMFL